jgi:hypothetical protein
LFFLGLLQLAELEARLLEAESRADEAEDKVSFIIWYLPAKHRSNNI